MAYFPESEMITMMKVSQQKIINFRWKLPVPASLKARSSNSPAKCGRLGSG
jgi:hypothetical protein